MDAYRMCLFQIPRFGSLVYTSLSLVFGKWGFDAGGEPCKLNWPLTDLAVFVTVLLRTRAPSSRCGNSNISNILNTITRDTATYFSVIFSSHFLLVLMLVFVRVRVLGTFFIRFFALTPTF